MKRRTREESRDETFDSFQVGGSQVVIPKRGSTEGSDLGNRMNRPGPREDQITTTKMIIIIIA